MQPTERGCRQHCLTSTSPEIKSSCGWNLGKERKCLDNIQKNSTSIPSYVTAMVLGEMFNSFPGSSSTCHAYVQSSSCMTLFLEHQDNQERTLTFSEFCFVWICLGFHKGYSSYPYVDNNMPSTHLLDGFVSMIFILFSTFYYFEMSLFSIYGF